MTREREQGAAVAGADGFREGLKPDVALGGQRDVTSVSFKRLEDAYF